VNLPLKTTLQTDENPYNAEECNVDLPQTSSTDEYQIELQVTDCLINDALYELYT